MSEDQDTMLKKMVAAAVEARKHPCKKCGHGPGTHAFDVYQIDENSPEPCWRSCMECFDNQTERLKK